MSTMDITSDFARSMSAATPTIHEPRTVDQTLRTMAEVTHNSVPGFPCMDTLDGSDVVTAPGLRAEQRWAQAEQRWAQCVPPALALGVRSQLALRLHHGDDTIGSLNPYSTVCGEVSHDALAPAGLFAAHCAVALGYAEERAHLTEALQSRRIIGQAIGILMERYEMNEDRAFAFLVRASSHSSIKLRAVAQELVDERNSSVGTR